MAGILPEIEITMKRISGAVMFCLLSAPVVFAQVDQWPFDLSPSPDDRIELDSGGITFVSQQALYMNTITNSDSLWLLRKGRSYDIYQSLYYRYEKNNLFESRKQYLDLSGSVLKKRVVFPWMSMGIDWTPMLLLNSSRVNHALSSSLDLGPVVRAGILSVPIVVRGGLAGKLQNDRFSISDFNIVNSPDMRHDQGVFGAFEVGDTNTPVYSLPIYLSIKGYGRILETSKMITGIGSALFYKPLLSGDTVSILYADSIINGSGVVLGDEGAQGKSFFLDIPQSIVRSSQVKAGIKGKYRLLLQPAFIYSYSQHSIEYPSEEPFLRQLNALGDRENRVQSINMMLKSDSSIAVHYSGGLRIDLEREEKLFNQSINMPRTADSSNRDTLNVKLNDYNGFRAIMSQAFSLFNANGVGFEYSFNIARYLKTYPNSYFEIRDTARHNYDTVKSNDDKDWIVQSHHIGVTPLCSKKGKITVMGEYSTNLNYYLKGAKSANNSIDYIYLIGVSSFFKPLQGLKGEAEIVADAKRTEYVFPEDYLKLGFLPPSYSREITSRLGFTREGHGFDSIKTAWGEHYEDDGYWYGTISVDDSVKSDSSNARSAFYGIERKQWRHGGSLIASKLIAGSVLSELGTSVDYIYQKKYSMLQREFVIDTAQTRWVLVPFLTMESKLNKYFTLKLKIKRYIDTVKDDYWDFAILFRAGF